MQLYFISLGLIFFWLLALAIAAAWLFRRVWSRPTLARATAINATLLALATGFTLLLLELAAYQFIIFPDGFNISLASNRWFERYWKPVNSWRMRGPEPDLEDFAQGPSLLFIGDSFTAGSGLEDYRDQFSWQAKIKLKERWKVETVCGRGWDTDREYIRLTEFPIKPDKLVLQYYLNDIGHAVVAMGKEDYYIRPPALPLGLQWLADNSYLLNFIYLQVFRAGQLLEKETFWDNLQRYYADHDIWTLHAQMLDNIVVYCRENDIELSVLIFPNLFAVEDSRPITDKVKFFFQDRGIQVIDLREHFTGRDPASLVINVTNGHPNAPTHHEVADIIIRELDL